MGLAPWRSAGWWLGRVRARRQPFAYAELLIVGDALISLFEEPLRSSVGRVQRRPNRSAFAATPAACTGEESRGGGAFLEKHSAIECVKDGSEAARGQSYLRVGVGAKRLPAGALESGRSAKAVIHGSSFRFA